MGHAIGSGRGSKPTVLSLLVLVLWLPLAGCGGETSDAPEEETGVSQTSAAETINPARLTDLGAVAGPTFSPDGTKIAFVNTRGGLSEYGVANDFNSFVDLYVMNVDGTDLVNLTNLDRGVFYHATPLKGPPLSWSPDETKLTFASSRGVKSPQQVDSPEIYAVNVDGTGLTNLTNNSANDFNPALSPDGKKIVFMRSTVNSRPPSIGLYVMNADGSLPTPLENLGVGSSSEAVFSPDGTKIVFTSSQTGSNFEIYVINTDGTELTNLTNSPSASDLNPALSPDGKKIAFMRSTVNSRPPSIGLYVMNVDGTDSVNLNSSAENDRPVFSPDGEKIAFTSNPSGSNYEIYVVNIDGTGLTNLTNNDSAHDSQPAFSPDGKKMAYVSAGYDSSGNYVADLYTMDVSGVT